MKYIPGLNSQRLSALYIAVSQFWRFFIADSEKMKNITADQLCFRADQLSCSLNQRCSQLKISALFQREAALNQRCSTLTFCQLWSVRFSKLNSADLFWISSDITWTGKTSWYNAAKVMKTFKVVIKMALLAFKECKFLPMFCKMTAKTRFFWNSLKNSTNQTRKCFWRNKPYQFCYLSSNGKRKLSSFCYIFDT